MKFFIEHPQLQEYLENGKLEVAYFDGSASQEIHLRYSDKLILPKSLNQPMVALANYFFDSIPTDLFLIQDKVVSACSIDLHSKIDPGKVDTSTLINNLDVKYYSKVIDKPYYNEDIFNEILEDYKSLVTNTYLYFPHHSLRCIANLKEISSGGLMVLSMDKGFHEIPDIDNKQPDIVAHGSLSLWVNYHALGAYCEKEGGKAYFPSFSTFHLDIACLMFLPETESYIETNLSYQKVVNDFGPDEFNSLKKMAYFNVAKLTITEIIALVRMSAYDSSFFIKLLPKLKQVFLQTTHREQKIIVQTIHEVWNMYFNINENYDLAYELGGMYYDLADYPKALDRFQDSSSTFGQRADIYYNQALCYYQLRQDELFLSTLKEGKEMFPTNKMFANLDKLDMSAK